MDAHTLYGYANAWLLKLGRFPHQDLDDLKQGFVEAWIRATLRGKTPSGRLCALRSIRAHYGDKRHRNWSTMEELAGRTEGLPVRVMPAPDERTALCMVRLAQVWPTLTSRQQAGILTLLGVGTPTELGRELGASASAIISARCRALERIDDPRSFTRVATRSGA